MKNIFAILTLIAVLGVSAWAAIPQPVGVNNKTLGGGDFNYNPTTGAGQIGVVNAVGLNNIGLLVKTWGTVTYVDTVNKFFYIDDGSNLKDGNTLGAGGAPVLGVRVSYKDLAVGNTFTPPSETQKVVITGISSTSLLNTTVIATLKPRRQGDMTPM